MVELEFKVLKLRVLKEYNRYADVIAEVRIEVIGRKSGVDHKYSKLWVVHFDLQSVGAKQFVPLSEVTKDDVLLWVNDTVGDRGIEQLRGEIAQMFDPVEYYVDPKWE